MKTRFPSALLAVSLLSSPSFADEGEWTPDQIAALSPSDVQALRQRGLELAPADLWDGKGGGLLTASVSVGGCSASFVSAEGLIATNHHCAFGAVQLASTPEKNYLRDGFAARTRAEEIQARGGASRVLVLKRIVDVTDRVRGPGSPFAKAGTDRARYEAVERAKREIVAECETTANARCQVAAFYDGLEFKLQEQTELKDVRLVYVPPRAVGEFGGDEDNFSWPRHTGDFSILRAYVSPTGASVSYSKENVPYKPAAWLKVSTKGVKPGDLLLVMGYPGRTQRYLDAKSIRNLETWFYPLRAKTYAEVIKILEDAGNADAPVALKVADTIKSLANVEKNARGQIAGLARNRVAEKSEKEAAELAEWIAKEPNAPAAWKTARADLDVVLEKSRATRERDFWLDEIERAPSALRSALQALRFAEERPKPDLDRDAGFQDRDLERAKDREKDFTKSYAAGPQRKQLAYLVAHALAAPDAPKSLVASFGEKAGADAIETRLADLDEKSTLADESTRLALYAKGLAELKSSSDPWMKLAVAVAADLADLRARRRETGGALLRLRPAYLSALKAFRAVKGRPIYPDANGTLRLSVAEVKGYSPKEAVISEPKTSLKGLQEKETGVTPFASPERVLKAARAGDWGRWFDPAVGTVPICFLANADTTGGNSGSPVVNGKGELVGLNFDRVFENVAGDFGWSPYVSRNVNVDVRYALWMMDRVDGVPELVKELIGFAP